MREGREGGPGVLHNEEGCFGASSIVKVPKHVEEGVSWGCYGAWNVDT